MRRLLLLLLCLLRAPVSLPFPQNNGGSSLGRLSPHHRHGKTVPCDEQQQQQQQQQPLISTPSIPACPGSIPPGVQGIIHAAPPSASAGQRHQHQHQRQRQLPVYRNQVQEEQEEGQEDGGGEGGVHPTAAGATAAATAVEPARTILSDKAAVEVIEAAVAATSRTAQEAKDAVSYFCDLINDSQVR